MDVSAEKAVIGRLSAGQYMRNMGKALLGRPTVYGTDQRLLELSVMVQAMISKSLMEETASPSWRQQQGDYSQETIASKAFKFYGLNPWVYACVYANSNSYASAPLQFKAVTRELDEEGNETKTEKLITDPRVRKLLRRPNPYETMYDLREATCAYLELCGTAYWEVGTDPATGDVVALWSVRPDLLEPVGTRDKLITHYVFKGQNVGLPGNQVVPAERIIQFRYFHPTSDHIGFGSFEASALAAEQMIRHSQWDRDFWKNGARFDTLLTTDQPMSGEALNRMVGLFERRHRGAGKGSRTAALSHGLKAQVMDSVKDMDWEKQRKMSREEAFACFNVVPAVVSVVDEARFKNVGEQLELYWANGMVPKLTKERGTLDRDLSPLISRMIGGGEVVAAHDLSKIKALQPDLDKATDRSVKLFVNGLVKRNEGRALVQLDAVPDDEDGWYLDVASPMGALGYQPVQASLELEDGSVRDLTHRALPSPAAEGVKAASILPFASAQAKRG